MARRPNAPQNAQRFPNSNSKMDDSGSTVGDRQPCLNGYIQRKGNRITGVANVEPAMTSQRRVYQIRTLRGRRCKIEDAQRDSVQAGVKRPHQNKKRLRCSKGRTHARRGDYARGPIDGLVGKKTCAAIRAFELASGLAKTGEFDLATVARLWAIF
ncbi:peptidoglycan-binding domain-containing protein [Rhizobium herbae]